MSHAPDTNTEAALVDSLRDDESFAPQAAPEAFLQQRLAEARWKMANRRIDCDDRTGYACGEDITCGCGDSAKVIFPEVTA